MLRIIQNSAAASAKSYYAHSDYLSEGQELTGRWGGRTAQMLGLAGDVEKLSFDRLCDNLDPRSGNQLTLRTNSDRTVGYDFNFHLPKGVSLAYTLGEDERILDAFRDSVDETMREIEQEAKTRVRKHGVEADRTTSNLVWAQFIHKTARPVNGEPDPLLHAHCFVFNTTWDMKEQAFKAGQFRDLKRDAPYFQAAFHARMALRMRGLGYEIRRDGKNWDIATIPKALCDKFSRRKEQIEEYARVNGVASEAEKADLGARTREKKESGLSMPELQELWNQRLTDDERQLFASHPKTSTPIVSVTPELANESASLSHATDHCLERHSVVPMKTLLAEALRHGVGKVSVEGTHRQLDQHRIIRREVENRMMATSPAVLAEEQEMLRFARSGVGRESALNPNWTIQQEWLNADQKDAVRHVLNSKDLVMVIRGGAGTGKTSLMREAVNGIEATGRKVFTFAPSSDASRGVLRSKGFEATTVAELLANPELQQATKGNVVWIDEAGLLGSRTLKKVMDIAAKIILASCSRATGGSTEV